jgi:hypothetical protein
LDILYKWDTAASERQGEAMEDPVAQALDRLTAELSEQNTQLSKQNTRLAALEVVVGDAYRMMCADTGVVTTPPEEDFGELQVPEELVRALRRMPASATIAVPMNVPGVGDVVAHVDPTGDADPQAQMHGIIAALRPFAMGGPRVRTSHTASASGSATSGHP